MTMKGYDFAGYAARNNVRCTDGTVIRPGCFSDMDGKTVPLVWQHNHDSIGEVLGHAVCEERPDGLYVYAYCNDTENGRNAKEAVKHGDINAFSIWANNLKRKGSDILHGIVREVSLVLAGADRTAIIDAIAHADESYDDIERAFDVGEGQAEIQFLGGYGDIIMHSDEDEEDSKDNEEEEKVAKPEESAKTDKDKTVQDILDTFTKEQRAVLNYIVGKAIEDAKKGNTPKKAAAPEAEEEENPEEDKEDEVKHADEPEEEEEKDPEEEPKAPAQKKDAKKKTVKDVLDTFNEEQRTVLNYIVGKALEDAKKGKKSTDDTDEDSDEEDKEVKHNAFEEYGYNAGPRQDYISHDDMVQLAKDAKTLGGSLKEAYIAAEENGTLSHAAGQEAGTDYGIANVDYLFPDAKAINNQPDLITRNMDWVDGVLSAVHRTPFSRVKSIHANVTEDEARAKGYIKGKLKKEEVFSLLKRATYPQTVYKKQRLDKDDIDDITDFDVVAWLKAEMQVMLREEIARAILIGDGRLASEDDKIKEENIRPIYNDADLYTVKFPVEIAANASDDEKARALMKAQLKARKLYKGSGNPTFYTTEDDITDMLLVENGIGERMYKSEAEVATAMRVKEVVPVTPMEGLQIEIADASGNTKTKYDVAGITVNLQDYNVGTNGGAKTEFFDDFDLDYNQQVCLYETRLSGAMVKPFAAICFYYKPVAATSNGGNSIPASED